jgi:hypothetical protein
VLPGPGEDQDVLVLDHHERDTLPPGVAYVLHLEERRPGDQPAVADAGEKGDTALRRSQARSLAGGENGGGQVDEFTALPPGPGGDHHGAAGAQDASALREDLGEGF